jgi:hypothetical protein
MWALDTLVDFFRGDGRVAERLPVVSPAPIFVGVFELETGIAKSSDPAKLPRPARSPAPGRRGLAVQCGRGERCGDAAGSAIVGGLADWPNTLIALDSACTPGGW